MLLRDCGIPTRYVSGVVCFERHPSGRYYIARFRNAHAWVEAYDRERKQWVMLDATPASVTAAPAPAEGWRDRFDSEIDYWKLLWQQLLSDLRRGKVAAAIIGFAVMVWQVAAALVLHPVIGPARPGRDLAAGALVEPAAAAGPAAFPRTPQGPAAVFRAVPETAARTYPDGGLRTDRRRVDGAAAGTSRPAAGAPPGTARLAGRLPAAALWRGESGGVV